MPSRSHRSKFRYASLGLAALAMVGSQAARGQVFMGQTTQKVVAPGANPGDKNVILTADLVTQDDINNTVSATGHVELVQGAEMLLAERVIWNKSTDIVIATGNVKLVNDTGDIYFGDYLEITSDMRQAFMTNVSGLLSDNSRLVGREATKDGNVMTLNRSIYSACELCKDDPTQPPTWRIKAVKVIHDSDTKRIYYHDATFLIEDVPIAWTPYFSTYDPSVKRADGFLETLPGYKSQLGGFLKTSYYFDIAPDMDAVLDAAYFSHQGPLVGGQFRERFDTGAIQISGAITESDIRQYPTAINQDQKTDRGYIFATGEFDLSDNWRAGFQLARSEDDIFILKYGYSGLQVLPEHVFAEGFYDRGYVNVSLWSFQDLRANIDAVQPHALPYATYSFFGEPGETLGGRWADSGSVLTIQTSPGEDMERITNNFSWGGKFVNDMGLVTVLNASAETDWYWTQNPELDPITDKTTAKASTGRFFPQAYATVSYPLAQQLGYAQWVVEPIASLVVAPSDANNSEIPNQDSQDIQLNAANLFSGNRFPGTDRIDDGSRFVYGIRTGLYNLGTGYTTVFLGQSYRISGDTVYPPDSGLQTRFSDLVGEINIVPGKLVDIDYNFEWSNDLRTDRVQEINFRVGPDQYGVTGTYLFAGQVTQPNFTATERNELNMGAYYRFNDHWSVNASSTSELSHPRAVLRYGLSAGYNDDCSTFTLNLAHDQTLPVGGTSGTAVFIQFSLKDLGIFRTPSIH